MNYEHDNLKEIQTLISELPKTKEFAKNVDFKNLCLSLKKELLQKYEPAAINQSYE